MRCDVMKLFEQFKKGASHELSSKSAGMSGVLADMTRGSDDLRTYSVQFSEAFARNPYVYRCANLRASAVSSIHPLLLDDDGNEISNKNHPLYKLLKRPSRMRSWRDLVYDVEVNLAIGGNAFLYIIKGIAPSEIWGLEPSKISYVPTQDTFDPVSEWTYSNGASVMTIYPDDLVHVHLTPRPGHVLGMSPLEPAALSITNQTSAREWNCSMMTNGAKPSLSISVPDTMSADMFNTFSSRLRGAFSGASNTGSIMVLDGGKTVTPLGLSAVDMDYNAGIMVNAREIASAMSVPPELIGDSANKTYSNAQEANKEFAQHTVIPQLDIIMDSLSAYLCPYYDDVASISYDKSDVAELKGSMAERMTAVQTSTFLTVNEKRALMGYDSVGPDGDVVLMPMGNIPLSESAMPTTDIDAPDTE